VIGVFRVEYLGFDIVSIVGDGNALIICYLRLIRYGSENE